MLLPIPLTCGVAMLAAVVILPRLMAENAVQDAIDTAHRTVQQFQAVRAYYTQKVSARVLANSAMRTTTDPAGNPGAIPAPSTMVHELSDLLVGQGTRVHVYSPYPFPNRAGRVLEPFQQEAWSFLSTHPDDAFARQDVVDGRPVVRVALADRMTDQACVSCHNATVGLGKRDWKLGDVRGVMEVDSDVGARLDRDRHLTLLVLGCGLVVVLVLCSIAGVLARRISVPIRSLTAVMHRLAAGDTAVEVPIPKRGDEVGVIASAVDVFKRNAVAKLRQDEELRQANRDLSQVNIRFDAALNSMSLGLCLCDASDRIVVINDKLKDLLGLEDVAPGIPFRDLVHAAIRAGNHPGRELDELMAEAMARIAIREPMTSVLELRNGRTVFVSRQPTVDGGWVATYEDVTERQRAEAKIAHMARHDALTGLPNRVLLNERLEAAMAEAGRGVGIAVLCLDLDRFKSINDTLGHSVGDELLRAVADRLGACVREVDTVARLGGDEFVVVQVGAERAEDAGRLADRIIAALSEPFTLSGHTVVVGTSIGIALAPDDATGADRLLKCADTALYRAKADGRGVFCFFEQEMDARLQARRALELDLRGALQRGEFLVYYQPLVDLRANRVSSFEALVRWMHPERGMISPGEFVPVAEEIGLIVPLGEWVLHRACQDAVGWPGAMKVAVNLSPAQFRDGRLVDVVRSALAASGLPPARLELEITESVLLQDSDATVAILNELRELGTPISMDDFGTGYSSLSYLRSFPFDKIKIDRSFISDLGKRSDAEYIVRAVAGLGINLGMRTTAEGVETMEQLNRLRREGCTEAQGYLFSPPRPQADIAAILRRAEILLHDQGESAADDSAAATALDPESELACAAPP